MAVMDFPSSPTNGQTYGQYTFDSSKGAWRVSANTASAVVTSATAPSSPVAGNLWYNTTDGSTYVYFNDGDTSQWVELRSEVATSQVGLVPIVPTSVTVSSGTASVATDGTVTFSGASGISIDGVFGTSFRNYRMMSDVTSVNNAIYLWQGRVGSTTTTSANYYYNELYASAGSVGASGAGPSGGVTNGRVGYMEAGTFTSLSVDIYSPNIASHTQTFSTQGRLSGTGTPVLVNNMGGCQLTSQFTGFYLSPSAGTFSGTLKFYGYK